MKQHERAETSLSGRLNRKTFTYYFGSGRHRLGIFWFACILTSMASVEALRVYSDHFMAVWADRDASNSDEESVEDFQRYCLWISLALVALSSNSKIFLKGSLFVGSLIISRFSRCFSQAGAFARAYLVIRIALRSSQEIHHRLLLRLMGASLDFFDAVPRGRILGHFSKDVDAVDALLPQYLLDFLQVGLGVMEVDSDVLRCCVSQEHQEKHQASKTKTPTQRSERLEKLYSLPLQQDLLVGQK